MNDNWLITTGECELKKDHRLQNYIWVCEDCLRGRTRGKEWIRGERRKLKSKKKKNIAEQMGEEDQDKKRRHRQSIRLLFQGELRTQLPLPEPVLPLCLPYQHFKLSGCFSWRCNYMTYATLERREGRGVQITLLNGVRRADPSTGSGGGSGGACIR